MAALGKLSLGACAVISLTLTLAACGPEEEQQLPPSAKLPSGPEDAQGGADWLGAQSRVDPAAWLAHRAENSAPEPGPEHAITKEYGRLLAEASKRFQEEPRMIANRAAQLETMLASNGASESVKSLLEGFIGVASEGRRRGFGEICQHYYNLRTKGYSRNEALVALRKSRDAGELGVKPQP